MTAFLALEDGTIFRGISIGLNGTSCGEVVFNTSMTGYQEIITDPSYFHQIVTFTSPHIGNVGINSEDMESSRIFLAGIVIKQLSLVASNWRSEKTLDEYLKQKKIVGIANIDTRKLTVKLQKKGALNGCIVSNHMDEAKAVAQANAFIGLENQNLSSIVSTNKIYKWKPHNEVNSERFKVVIYDFGVKHNIIRSLINFGCEITIVPSITPAKVVLALNPDGIVFSNGPGDPKSCKTEIENLQSLIAVTSVPILGICLGHQLLALAFGAATYKMKFGHHGSNHPVKDLATGNIVITTQNHGFSVDEASLPLVLVANYRSLFDGTLQGFRHVEKPIFGFQGHPEASPGPRDALLVFHPFIQAMKAFQNKKCFYAKTS